MGDRWKTLCVTTDCLTGRLVHIKVTAVRGQNATQLTGPQRHINISTCYEHYSSWNVTKILIIYYYEELNKGEYLTSISLCERYFQNVCTKLHGDIAEHRNGHSSSHQNLGIHNRFKICTTHVTLLEQVNKGGDT